MDNIEYKTTSTHRNCSKEYYYQNQEVVLAKARERYHLRKQKEKAEREQKLADAEQTENVIIPIPKKEKKEKKVKSEKPLKTIWDAVAYTDGLYRRRADAVRPCRPFDPEHDTASQIKHKELLWIIEGVTGENFNFNPRIWTGDVWYQEDSSMCLCSQTVKHNFIINHIPSRKKFIVGSECIKKVSPDFYKAILADKCKICQSPVMSRRPMHGREGYCSQECMPEKIKFGKHKGTRLDALPVDYMKFLVSKFAPSPLMEQLKQMIEFKKNQE